MGLLLVVAGVSEVRCPAGIRSIRGTLHHAVYRRQYLVHGFGPPRHGQRYGKSAQKWQLCKLKSYFIPYLIGIVGNYEFYVRFGAI